MPVFTCTGTQKHDLWLVDGSKDFAWFPGGIVPEFPIDLPIRLHVGDNLFGDVHITKKHGHWVSKVGLPVPELVWKKLQTGGFIYSAEKEQRLNFSLRISPDSLMVLDWRSVKAEAYFSVVTLYAHPSKVDGMVLGRYRPIKR